MERREFSNRWIFSLLLGLLLLGAYACNNDETEEPAKDKRGDLISSEFISGYTAAQIQGFLTASGIEVNVDVKYDVDVYRLVYFTAGEDDGILFEASGAVMVPKAESELPVISFQHGTQTKRDMVASRDPMSVSEGFAGIVAASAGFVTFVPDYLGLGVSSVLHPYLHHDLSAGPVLDILRAGKTFCDNDDITLNGDLYIGGYSEGGYVTLAAQEEIEKQSSFVFSLVASAPQAGPYDLHGTVDYFIDIDEYPEPAFMAYLLTAYDYVYDWGRVNDIFRQPYSSMMYDLFDGTNTIGQISSMLPSKISTLLKDEFITGFKNGTELDFLNAIDENTSLNWKPKAAVRFYHSNSDELVPYQNSLTAVEKFRNNGAKDIELVTIEGLDHGDAGLVAVTGMLEWFDSLRVARR